VPGDNELERRRWNDQHWTDAWPRRERLTGAVTPLLLARAALRPGQRVLDVGSGGGNATLAAAAGVGAGGQVTGADLSGPLVDLARRRAAAAGAGNVDFLVADVQAEPVPGAPFDVAVSQFGVMFFDEPVRAFGNVRRLLRPGGQLTFVCWQAPDRNPWFAGPALAPFVPPAPEPPPGKRRTGPFSLADAEDTSGLLVAAGWREVAATGHRLEATVAADALVDDAQLSFLGVPPERLDEAREAVQAYLRPLRQADGAYRAPLAVHVVAATA
jgi:SAM-dependent methyltransferase